MYSHDSAVKSKFKVSSYTKNHNTQAKNSPASPKEIIRANDSKKQLQAPPPPRNRVSIRKHSPQIEKVSSGNIKASVPPSSLETPSEAQSEQSATKIKNTQVKNGKQPNINSKSNKNEAIVANHKYPNNLPKTTKATRTEIKNKTGSPRL
ncbi:hypothetical protein TRFO_29508 [Tritrichomonas foetus]|uniref:Uncharacterized protein n=1 Tax=Tritrichomonas foetus TaxID=1144522 RepID=A0A1J4JVP4_9EUKA|nr:hypothetical protein TRFO_29508 [Tritrichomonas foetus]|eukprot:OHT03199.1 hypothetical protein TRFO_29508 [Tritrichomonas foetus]